MKNQDAWQATKFILTTRGLRASRDARQVGRGSRYGADLVASHYEHIIRGHARGRLLDLGCGFVPLYATYHELVEDIVCIDWQNTLHPSPYLDFTTDLNEPIPIEESSFDTILLTDVLEHIAEPAALIQEIARLLRPGGKLLAGVPFLYCLHEEPFDFYRYTEHALRRYCQHNQLEVLLLEPYGGLLEVLADLTSKGVEAMPSPLRPLLRSLHAASSSVFGSKGVGRGFSQKTARRFPLGYTLVAASHKGRG